MAILHDSLLENLDEYREGFLNADPFKHVLIPNFFDDAVVEKMLRQFPKPNPDEMINEYGEPSQKFTCPDVRNIGPIYRKIDDFIRSPRFANIMKKLTGIDDLLYDPEYHGAGTHDNFSGQGMDPHVDFNLHRTTGYHRRINAIIYLNEEWEESWGGCLQVHKNPWDPENDYTKTFLPLKNHCVLFETNEISWHGFKPVTHPTNNHISRKSFTIYMYTKERPVDEVANKHATVYVPRPLPDHLVAGHTLTEQDVTELRNNFSGRNAMVKYLYDEEKHKNGVINTLGEFRENFKIPFQGFVSQDGPVSGIHGNLGVEKRLAFSVAGAHHNDRFSFDFRLPEFLKTQSVKLSVNGEEIGRYANDSGHLKGEIALDPLAETHSFEFLFDVSKSPFDANIAPDRRKYAAFIETMAFLPKQMSRRKRIAAFLRRQSS